MVAGGKNEKLRVRGKKEERERKREENYIKTEKMAYLFGLQYIPL